MQPELPTAPPSAVAATSALLLLLAPLLSLALLLRCAAPSLLRTAQLALRPTATERRALAALLAHGAAGHEQDAARAHRIFASLPHEHFAQMSRAELCLNPYQESVDVGLAKSLLLAAARSGFVAAHYYLGDLYHFRLRDKALAALHYIYAQDAGYSMPMVNLARFLTEGCEEAGITRNVKRALHLSRRAVEEQSDCLAKKILIWVILEQGMPKSGQPMEPTLGEEVLLLLEELELDYDFQAILCLARLLSASRPEWALPGIQPDIPRALDLFERALYEGACSQAASELGCLLRLGDKIERDVPRALKAYRYAADVLLDADAMTEMADIFHKGEEGIPRDLAKARDLYERAVEAEGIPKAVVQLSYLYQCGSEAVTRNEARAAELLKSVSREPNAAHALHKIASALHFGQDGFEQDGEEAFIFYLEAIYKHGHVKSSYGLAQLLLEGAPGVNPNVSYSMLLIEAAVNERSNYVGMIQLGNVLVSGMFGQRTNIPRAVPLYERAFEEGQILSAGLQLAVIFGKGAEGVPRDGKRAAELFERVLPKVDDADAMLYYAKVLHFGDEGLPRDGARALELCRKALRKGGRRALRSLGKLFELGAGGGEPDAKEAAKMYEQAVTQHRDAISCVYLARLLSTGGPGLERDIARALKLCEQACRPTKMVEAKVLLGKLLESGGDGVEKDRLRAGKLYNEALMASQMDVFKVARLWIGSCTEKCW